MHISFNYTVKILSLLHKFKATHSFIDLIPPILWHFNT